MVKGLSKLGAASRRVRQHWTIRGVARTVAVLAALFAATMVSLVAVDSGPVWRGRAEDFLSDQLQRPVHIGRMKVNIVAGLLLGRVELEDFVIEGLTPTDRPFFKAGSLSAALDWWPAVTSRPTLTITSVELKDWQMLVEKWKGGDNFPKFRRNNRPPSNRRGPSRVIVNSFRGTDGQFAYEDQETPWSVFAPNITITIGNLPKYNGRVTSKGGLVTIQDHVPMWSDVNIRFTVDGNRLLVSHADFVTDGAKSSATGEIDMARWPEQTYKVKSKVQFQRMRELFFAKEDWPLAGEGDFTGVFHLFKGGHDLSGHFTSAEAGVYDYRFPSLYGSLHWNKYLFDIRDAGAKFSGGDATFTFSIKPLGAKVRPTASFDVNYANVDLVQLTDFFQLAGLRLSGGAAGRNLLEWQLGRGSERHGEGYVAVVPPPGTELMSDSLDAARSADPDHALHEWGPFAPVPLDRHQPIGGGLRYAFGPDRVFLDNGTFATRRTHAVFEGSTAWDQDAQLKFHVTSSDWQESQLVLAGILTDFGSRTGPVSFGGRGRFDGTMTGPFRRPRVEGVFAGEDLRAWDTMWGEASANIVVENNYVTVTDGIIRENGSEISTSGKFSLGYPRRDGGEELNARFRVTKRNLDGLRHAFEIDDYPVSGLLSGEFQLTGQYEHPFGTGSMTLEEGVAYGEPFERGTAALRFDGAGVRLDGITIAKASGTMTGAAYVGWDSTYSFNADARTIPLESVAAFAYPSVKPTGTLEFTANGSGVFDDPKYDVDFMIDGLAVSTESVGDVEGSLTLHGDGVSGEFEVVSERLDVSGTGRISLSPREDSEVMLRFNTSSLDPYVRLFVPQLLPYTTAVATGSIKVTGQLGEVDQLLVDGTIDALDLKLFEYEIRNAAPIKVALDQHVVRVNQLELIGEDTRLSVGGTVGLHDQRIAVQARGEANLGILQGFFKDVRGSGSATLAASVDGPLYEPVFSGSATIVNGRVRHFSLPNSLDDINGTIHFDANGVRLDDVTATFGDGRVQFGGRVGLNGYLPGDLNVLISGEDMNLRYPQDVRSTVDADLTIRGNVQAPMVGGIITVQSAIWNRRIDPTAGLFDMGSDANAAGATDAPQFPLTYDIEVRVPGTLRIENNLARLWASAELQMRGTYDRPLLFGRADVDRGQVTFEGRRYVVTKGAIEFTNPLRIDPFFDVEAETRVRVPGQTYRVTVRAAGTMERLQPTLESDPPLPAAEVLALLFSDIRRDTTTAEIRALQNPNEVEQDILATRLTQLASSRLSTEVGRVVEQTFGIDTFQLSPSLLDPTNQSSSTRVNPSARVTIGKRISERVYLTFSRSLSTSKSDQIILLEYDESDRLSWILSRNEDETYAIEVRVRHIF